MLMSDYDTAMQELENSVLWSSAGRLTLRECVAITDKIRRLNAELGRRDEWVASLEARLAGVGFTLSQRESELDRLNARIAELEAKLTAKDAPDAT
jgi:predicted nuclease with TOPRIM domain